MEWGNSSQASEQAEAEAEAEGSQWDHSSREIHLGYCAKGCDKEPWMELRLSHVWQIIDPGLAY
jgi:hypothetical protein